MAETGKGNTGEEGKDPQRGSFWDSFDRALAEINATIDRLQKDLPPPEPRAIASGETAAPRVRRRAKPRRKQTTQSSQPPPAETPDRSAAQPAGGSATPPEPEVESRPAETAPPLPTGTDLGDPKSFGLMPPVSNLDPGTASPEEYRKRLAHDLAFASKVLHTSRVPAPVWREWRSFERTAQQRLRALAGEST